jgi:hypothetical protein
MRKDQQMKLSPEMQLRSALVTSAAMLLLVICPTLDFSGADLGYATLSNGRSPCITTRVSQELLF